MGLTIVWRNPIPSNCEDIPVERIADDDSSTVYEVRRPGGMAVFEVTHGCKFARRRPPWVHHVGESA
jgi:hypothetical protein